MFLEVPGILWHMPTYGTRVPGYETQGDTKRRLRLGALVAKRRNKLRLSKEEAARRASISSISWKRVEDGLGVRDLTYSAVEQVLGWEPDSIKRYFHRGVEPVDPPDEVEQAAPTEVSSDEVERLFDGFLDLIGGIDLDKPLGREAGLAVFRRILTQQREIGAAEARAAAQREQKAS